jgi:hypothetical protein
MADDSTPPSTPVSSTFDVASGTESTRNRCFSVLKSLQY